MRNILILLAVAVISGINQSCIKSSTAVTLQNELIDYIKDKDATIGVTVIIDRTDTININGNHAFPMLSVYKFPIAVALGDYLRESNGRVEDTITITQVDLKPDTYSPMREKYACQDSIRLSIDELLTYALEQSDNNASDILLKIMGGTDNVMSALKRLGIDNVNVVSTEAEMYENNMLCYENSATPIAIARLTDVFNHEFSDTISGRVKQLMEKCGTGANRLAKPLIGSNAILGHKTGTGFALPTGRLMAVNDIGYVNLPNGHSYSIAVFVENSGYDMARSEEIIATISGIVYLRLGQGHF